MSRATIQAIDRDQALRFWQGQRDGRIFLHPDVLESMCPQVDWWLGSWNTWPACLWPVCHGADGIHAPPELAAYVGPMWADDTLAGPAHRQWTTTSRLQELFLQEFATRYRRFRFELPPGSTDIRVLQWFAREHAAAWRVDIDCRHTLVLHRPATVDAASVAAGFGRDRAADLRLMARKSYVGAGAVDAGELYALYEQLIAGKQEPAKALRRQAEVQALVSLAQGGFGRIVGYRDDDGALASFALTMGTGPTIVQPLTASAAAVRKDGIQARVRLDAMLQAFQGGAQVVDLTGGNSRAGAEDLHRYGGEARMYFRVDVAPAPGTGDTVSAGHDERSGRDE